MDAAVRHDDCRGHTFEEVADEYDAARPSYPNGIFDVFGPRDGLRVLDVGAGTATRELIARRASVIAVDPGRESKSGESDLDPHLIRTRSSPSGSKGRTRATKAVDLPCAGVFEMEDGEIKVWRDYFDMAIFTTAMS